MASKAAERLAEELWRRLPAIERSADQDGIIYQDHTAYRFTWLVEVAKVIDSFGSFDKMRETAASLHREIPEDEPQSGEFAEGRLQEKYFGRAP